MADQGFQVASDVGAASDPYAGTGFEQGTGRITQRDTTSGARDGAYWRQNIINSFISFGYYPTEAEVSSLVQSSSGSGGTETGQAAVATYVNYQKAEIQRQQNDPLKAYQTKAYQLSQDQANRSQNLYKQAQDLLSQAPKLFGSFTPEQIQQYLAPLQTAFEKAQATTQTANARSGIAGSSIEANALQAGNTQFQENVLSQGLSVGMQQQQNQANALLGEAQTLFGGSQQNFGAAGPAAGQMSSQNLGQTNLINSLPNFLNQQAMNTQLFNQSQDKGGFQDTFNQVTGDISSGVNAFQSLMLVPGQFKASPGGNPSTSGGSAGAFPQGSPTMNGGSSAFSYPGYANNPYLNTGATSASANAGLNLAALSL